MSDVIKSITVLKSSDPAPLIPLQLVSKLCAKYDETLPYECFLFQLNDEISSRTTSTCNDASCGLQNDLDARYCKHCGSKIVSGKKRMVKIESLDWCDEGSCETFESIFVNEVVPHIKGRIEAFVTYETSTTATGIGQYCFRVEHGKIEYCDFTLTVGAAPTFDLSDADDPDAGDLEDEDEEAEEEDEDGEDRDVRLDDAKCTR